ncbi:ImpA domain-containing protein [Salmonella enterica subsp. enterica]|nr:ImpA domain-containing protein [Salmonella enterica subsp. enterica]
MSQDALTHIIVTGQDPRGLPEFSALREEINKSSHPSQPELNWKLVESLALAIFKAHGVDLHTATYYTLARTPHARSGRILRRGGAAGGHDKPRLGQILAAG